jgi:L-ascorbate metabolism protein UlaG (beta-lactamase superfamily)
MQLHFIRHATLHLTYNGQRLLVDPMLSAAQAMDPVGNATSTARIPLVDLPLTDAELAQLISDTDAVLVTHTHRDHWDKRATDLLPKTLPIYTQPASEAVIQGSGFAQVHAIADQIALNGIEISRTGGHHGTGEIGQSMGDVSGFILKAPSEPTVYIAGDTIWCAEVDEALKKYQPDVVILNAGAAQFLTGDPITMNAADVITVCHAAPNVRIIAVHMEAINHCWLTRALLTAALTEAGLPNRVEMPADGAQLTFN